jgi:hypothetical protein
MLALGSPVRRDILLALRQGPLSVGALAERFPVKFFMEEVFDGLLAKAIGKSIPNLEPAFDEFAACLKRRAEAG